MTKAAKNDKLSKDSESYLASRAKPKKAEAPKTDNVVVTSLSINNGTKTFQSIVGEETINHGSSISLRPLDFYGKFMRRGSKKDNYRPLGETVMVKRGEQGKFFDTFGTEMCGRATNKEAANWSEEKKEANKAKGEYYGVLYAILESTGELIRLQLPSAKAMALSTFLDELQTESLFSTSIKVSLNEKGYFVAQILKTDLPGDDSIVEAYKTADKHVEQQNSWILRQYKSRNKGDSDTPVNARDDDDDESVF
jgi:hypothetical protein